MPKVGLFFYVNNKVLADSIDIDTAQTYGDFLIGFTSHYDIWSKLYEKEYNRPYDFFPRGRVVYNVKDKKYILYADKCIPKSGLVKIIKAFEIENENVGIETDEHYVCKKCNKYYFE